MRELALEHLGWFRVALFFACVGWFVVLKQWLRPSPDAMRRGILAASVQLFIGTLLDIALVACGAWTYREMPFSLGGVPLDLHVDWTLLWGFSVTWLWERISAGGASTRRVAVYLVGFCALTIGFDVSVTRWMIFLDRASAWWMLADAAFLLVTLGLTLWFYQSIGHAAKERCGLGRIEALSPRVRSSIYVAMGTSFFFIYLPWAMHGLAAHLGLPQRATPCLSLACPIALVAGALGIWAVNEFAACGEGTPIPWDAPRRLVTSGPYAHLSNPMQLSGVLLGVAAVAAYPTVIHLAYCVDLLALSVVVFLRVERDVLAERFGQAYLAYRHARPAFRPYLTRYEVRGNADR